MGGNIDFPIIRHACQLCSVTRSSGRRRANYARPFFYHRLVIVAVNTFVLYKKMAVHVSLGHKPVPQKLFRKCIACQRVGYNSIVHLFQPGGGDDKGGAKSNPPREAADRDDVEQNVAHYPVPISNPWDKDKANRSSREERIVHSAIQMTMKSGRGNA